MKIGKYDIKPILLYLPDTPEWVKRWQEGKRRIEQAGITDIYEVAGVHAVRWGITGRHIYLRDKRYEEQFYGGDANVGCYISHYILYQVMKALPYKHYMVLEDDVHFSENWKEEVEKALEIIPDNFDFLFVGSCCARDKEPIHIGGNLYHYPYREDKPSWYPQAGHCYIISQKCIQHLIDTNRDTADPIDISLIYNSFPKLEVYAILPRVADQGTKTLLPE